MYRRKYEDKRCIVGSLSSSMFFRSRHLGGEERIMKSLIIWVALWFCFFFSFPTIIHGRKLNSAYSSLNLTLIKQYSINGTLNDQMFPRSHAAGPPSLGLIYSWSPGGQTGVWFAEMTADDFKKLINFSIRTACDTALVERRGGCRGRRSLGAADRCTSEPWRTCYVSV